MNSTNQPILEQTEEQEYKKVIKANQIYEANLIDKISDNEYIVKGHYYVEYFGGEKYTCNCGDRTFRQVMCKHILAVQFYEMGV